MRGEFPRSRLRLSALCRSTWNGMGAGTPKRTYLVVVDDSEEARVALRFAARRAAKDLQALGVAEGDLKAIDKEIKAIVVAAAKYADEAPEPEPAELYTDVLVGSY